MIMSSTSARSVPLRHSFDVQGRLGNGSHEDLRSLAEDIRKLRELRDQIVSGRHAFYKAITAVGAPLNPNEDSSSALSQRIAPKLSGPSQRTNTNQPRISSSSHAVPKANAAQLTLSSRKESSASAVDYATSSYGRKSLDPPPALHHTSRGSKSPYLQDTRSTRISYPPSQSLEEKEIFTSSSIPFDAYAFTSNDDHGAEETFYVDERRSHRTASTSKRQRQYSPGRHAPSTPDFEGRNDRADRRAKSRSSTSPYQQTKASKRPPRVQSRRSRSPLPPQSLNGQHIVTENRSLKTADSKTRRRAWLGLKPVSRYLTVYV